MTVFSLTILQKTNNKVNLYCSTNANIICLLNVGYEITDSSSNVPAAKPGLADMDVVRLFLGLKEK